jgi:hypothetical protein
VAAAGQPPKFIHHNAQECVETSRGLSKLATNSVEKADETGDCGHAQKPDQPIVFNMDRFPKGDDHTASYSEQQRAGRREMYDTSFETIERKHTHPACRHAFQWWF